MGGVVLATSHAVSARFGISQLARLLDLAVSIPIGAGVFYGMCMALRVSDLDLAIRAFTAPIRQRLARRPA